jgi:hypothetical protein
MLFERNSKRLVIMRKYLVYIMFFAITEKGYSQEIDLSSTIQDIAEELAADESDPESVAAFTERLYELTESPAIINSSSKEISRLFFLSDFQIKALDDYIHTSGKIVSIFEIANIPGFDKEIVGLMIPFISLADNSAQSNKSSYKKSSLLSNFSINPYNTDTVSPGSQWKILSKYKYSDGGISLGFTIEKDPGEKFLYGTPLLPDFLSANISYKGNGIIKTIIIGDYSAHFGQGTNINTSSRRMLSLNSVGFMSGTDEIKPYTSSDENNFLRGVATELTIKNLTTIFFFSDNKRDATIVTPGCSPEYIESFINTGLHNTISLYKKKDAVKEIIYGVNLTYNLRNIKVGFTYSGDRLSVPVYPLEKVDNIFDFHGDLNNLYSIYYNSIIKKILLYGEYSLNDNLRHALVQGLTSRLTDRLTINFLYRDYDARYTGLHAKGPGSSSITANERGLLGNFTFEMAKHLIVSGGCDIQYYPWMRYRCSSPSYGTKKELELKFNPSDKLTINALYNYKLSITNSQETEGIQKQNNIITRSTKIAIKYHPNNDLTFASRFDYKFPEASGSKGIAVTQDINYKFSSLPLYFWVRYCVFKTDGYDTRIYIWENDLLNSYSVPALFDTGSRSYIMACWKIKDNVEFRIKYSITSKEDREEDFTNVEEFRMQFRITI